MFDGVVLTSGPNGGKTTVKNELRARGYTVVDEMATDVIRGGRLHPCTEPLEFRRETLARQKAAESVLPKDGTVILDRGGYDGTAYCMATGCPVPRFLDELESGRYKLAFIFEPVPTWDADGIRYEDLGFSYSINPILAALYRQKGARVVHVPLMPVQERVDLILSVLNEHGLERS